MVEVSGSWSLNSLYGALLLAAGEEKRYQEQQGGSESD